MGTNDDVIGGVEWLSTLDNRTTPMCQALDGLEWTIPGYEPKGHDRPFPGASPHWNCRSVILPVTKTWEQLAKEAGGDVNGAKELDELYKIPESQRASMGGPVPNMTYKEWEAEREGKPPETYEAVVVPPTPEPELLGKLFHVDKAEFSEWFRRMGAHYDELMDEYGDLKTVRQKMPKEDFAIANLPGRIKAALRTDADSLLFSPDSLAKQLNHHKELKASEYAKVLNKIEACTKKDMFPEGDHHVVLIVHGDRYYKVVLKTTKTRSEVYLATCYRLNGDSLEVFLKSHGVSLKTYLSSG